MKSANYNIRLDPDIKAKAEKAFAVFGLNLSEAINVFLHASIIHQGFPFELREPRFNYEVLQAMEETEQIIKQYADGMRKQKSFTNAHGLIQEILAGEDEDDV